MEIIENIKYSKKQEKQAASALRIANKINEYKTFLQKNAKLEPAEAVISLLSDYAGDVFKYLNAQKLTKKKKKFIKNILAIFILDSNKALDKIVRYLQKEFEKPAFSRTLVPYYVKKPKDLERFINKTLEELYELLKQNKPEKFDKKHVLGYVELYSLAPESMVHLDKTLLFIFYLLNNSDADLFFVFRDLWYFEVYILYVELLKEVILAWQSGKSSRAAKKYDFILQIASYLVNWQGIIELGSKTSNVFNGLLTEQINMYYALEQETNNKNLYNNIGIGNIKGLKNKSFAYILNKLQEIKEAGLTKKPPAWYFKLVKFFKLDAFLQYPTLNLETLYSDMQKIHKDYAWSSYRKRVLREVGVYL